MTLCTSDDPNISRRICYNERWDRDIHHRLSPTPLVEALRRLGLKCAEWAQVLVDTIRLKLFKIGVVVRVSARRTLLQISSAYPWKQIYAQVFPVLRDETQNRLPQLNFYLAEPSACGADLPPFSAR